MPDLMENGCLLAADLPGEGRMEFQLGRIQRDEITRIQSSKPYSGFNCFFYFFDHSEKVNQRRSDDFTAFR
jgi:hypothetical protein